MKSGLLASRILAALRFGVIFPVGIVLLRPMPTRWALAAMKRLRLDIRAAWEWERLYWLSRRNLSPRRRYILLRVWAAVTWLGRGLAWGCAMEAAYRVYNLSWYLNELRKHAFLEGEILAVSKIIKREVSFISDNLETASFNNHYAFNVFAMLIAGPINCRGDDDYWVAELQRVLSQQFYPDGSNFEASTAYHQLMIEAIARLVILRPDLRDHVSKSMNLTGAIVFSTKIAPESSLLWQVGDTDGSRVVDDGNTIAQLLQTAELGGSHQKCAASAFFPDFQVSFHEVGELSLALWAPKLGQGGRGGHNHADCLSLTCAMGNRAVIGDPGVPLYALARRQFRSAAVHSVPFPASEEVIKQVGAFQMSDPWPAMLFRSSANEATARCLKSPDHGYERNVVFEPGEGAQIVDRALGSAPHPCPKLAIDPNYKIELIDKVHARIVPRDGKGRSLLIKAVEGITAIDIIDSWYSTAYFQLARSSILRLISNQSRCRWRLEIL